MNDCQHEKLKPQSLHAKIVSGREFKYKAQSCTECGAVLWNAKAEAGFEAWTKLNRDKFVLQFSISESVAYGISEILQTYPGATDSHFVRAVLSVFINYIFASPSVSQQVTAVRDSNLYKSYLADSARVKMKVRINPNLLEIVETWAALIGLSVSKFVEECLMQVVALFGTRGSSSIWSDGLNKQIDTVMKAA